MIGHTIHQFRSVSSTNDLAKLAVEHGVSEGTIYMADHQTAGQGRRGAVWNDLPGESVLMTVVLYPTMPLDTVWRLGWAGCVAVNEALSEFGVTSKCKWPNDVVVGGRKIAGVLVQTVNRTDESYAALVGIGININQTEFDGSAGFRLPFTSVRLVTGQSIERIDQVAEKVCDALNRVYAEGTVLWPETVEWYSKLLDTGEAQSGIEVTSNRPLRGTALGIRETDGAALIRHETGLNYYIYPE